ncbi:hypothetical protein [Saccharopolyspora shandongensis]
MTGDLAAAERDQLEELRLVAYFRAGALGIGAAGAGPAGKREVRQ